jgi:hypothetical protein
MKRLVDALLELPSWQGILLIVAFVAIATGFASIVGLLAYRRGIHDAEAAAVRFNVKRRDMESIV